MPPHTSEEESCAFDSTGSNRSPLLGFPGECQGFALPGLSTEVPQSPRLPHLDHALGAAEIRTTGPPPLNRGVGLREVSCEDTFFALGRHKPPGPKETLEQVRGSLTLEEGAPAVESQTPSLVGVESRGTKRSMREQAGKVDLDHCGQGWAPGKQVLWAMWKVYDRRVLSAGIWLNQKGVKKIQGNCCF